MNSKYYVTTIRSLVFLLVTSGMVLCSDSFGQPSSKRPHFTIDSDGVMPSLIIDGKAEAPILHFSQEILDNYARQFSEAGFKLFACIEEHSFLDLGWIGDNRYDTSHLDKVLGNFSRRVPNGFLLPKIHVWAPEWWLDKHPQEVMGYGNEPRTLEWQPGHGLKHESFASELWKKEAGDGLRHIVRHILDSPYGEQVPGIMVAGGTYGEWHPWSWSADDVIDTSNPMRDAFRKYLREKYSGDLISLRKAWGAQTVTFESAAIPTLQQRHNGGLGVFRNPSEAQNVIDYYEAFHNVTVDAIDYFCRIIKDESEGELLTCVNYAYTPDIPWASQETHHRAAARAIRLESIDMFSSPHSYYHRALGEHGNLRHFPQSLALHGKLFIDEADERTHLAQPGLFKHAQTLDESVQVIWRSFANVVTQGVGMWFMDHTSREWYADPAFFTHFKKIKKWADHSVTISKKRVSEVALITSTKSGLYLKGKTDLTAYFNVAQINQLCKAGAPFDMYLIEDIEEGIVPNYKVYIFLDCFYVSDGQKAAIDKLKGDGKALVWFYAPGFASDEGLEIESMERLTGISFKMESSPFKTIEIDGKLFPDVHDFTAWQEVAGEFDRDLSPRFIPVETDAQVWGHYKDSKKPAMVVKDFGDWSSIYVPVVDLPWQLLNKIYGNAGVHLYCQDGDNFCLNQSWLGLHAVESGTKRIVLRESASVYDVINDVQLGQNMKEFDVKLKGNETALYLLSDSESHP